MLMSQALSSVLLLVQIGVRALGSHFAAGSASITRCSPPDSRKRAEFFCAETFLPSEFSVSNSIADLQLH